MSERNDKNRAYLKVLILVALIGAGAALIGDVLGIFPYLFPRGGDGGRTPPVIISPSLVEKELSDANINLSDTDEAKVRRFLRDDPAYQQLAADCLALMKGKRLVSVVPLDDINGKYKDLLGVVSNKYINASQYDNFKKLKQAIFNAWADKQDAGYWQKSFGDIAVPVGG